MTKGGEIIGIDSGRGLTRPPRPSFPDDPTTLRRIDAAQRNVKQRHLVISGKWRGRHLSSRAQGARRKRYGVTKKGRTRRNDTRHHGEIVK